MVRIARLGVPPLLLWLSALFGSANAAPCDAIGLCSVGKTKMPYHGKIDSGECNAGAINRDANACWGPCTIPFHSETAHGV